MKSFITYLTCISFFFLHVPELNLAHASNSYDPAIVYYGTSEAGLRYVEIPNLSFSDF